MLRLCWTSTYDHGSEASKHGRRGPCVTQVALQLENPHRAVKMSFWFSVQRQLGNHLIGTSATWLAPKFVPLLVPRDSEAQRKVQMLSQSTRR